MARPHPSPPEALGAWHQEHVHFARLLDLLEKEVAAFHVDEHPNYPLMIDILDYLQHYPDRFHHPREDAAFALLVERDPRLELPIARRLQEHRIIAAAGESLLALLREVVDEAFVARSAVETAAATYLVYYRHHLAAEEREVLPRAAEVLTAADWGAIAAAVPAGADPLFGADSAERYRELRRQIALES